MSDFVPPVVLEILSRFNDTGVAKAMAAVKELHGMEAKIKAKVDVEGIGDVTKLKTAMAGLKDRSVKVKVSTEDKGPSSTKSDGGVGKGSGRKAGEEYADEFSRAVATRVSAAIKALPDIKLKATTSEADMRINAVRFELKQLADTHLDVDVDAGRAMAEVAMLKRELQAAADSSPNIRVKVNAAKAIAELEAIEKAAGRVERSTKSGGDTKPLDMFRGQAKSAGKTSGSDFMSGFFGGITNMLPNFMGNILGPLGKLGDLAEMGSQVAGVAGKVGSTAGAVGKAGTAAGGAAGPIGAAASSIFAIAAAAAVAGAVLGTLPGLVAAVGGSVAALPGLAVGGGAAFGTLKLGLTGVGDAITKGFTPAAKAGGGAARKLRSDLTDFSDEERRIVAAQREVKRSQEDVSRARVEASRILRDYDSELRRGSLDERDASLSLKEATQRLRELRAQPHTRLEMDRARLSVDQANASLSEASIRYRDLQGDATRARVAGVDGSEQVQSALDRQMSAADSLASAYSSLAQAQRAAAEAQEQAASGGAAAIDQYQEALKKLSPNAQAFVKTLVGMRGEFGELKNMAQQHLFAGLDKELQSFVKTWMPEARQVVALFGDDWNQMAKRLSQRMQKPDVIEMVDGLSRTVDKLFDRLNGTTLDKLVGMFTRLGTAAEPFIEKLGNFVLSGLEKFSDWIDEQSANGNLDRWFDEAETAVENLGGALKEAVRVVGIFFDDIDDRNNDLGIDGIEKMRDFLKDIGDFLQSPAGQQAVENFIDGLYIAASAFDDIRVILRILSGDWQGAWDLMKDVLEERIALMITGPLHRFLQASELAIGWIPGIGPALKVAAGKFDEFVVEVNDSLNHLKEEKEIKITLKAAGDVGALGMVGMEKWLTQSAGKTKAKSRRFGGVDYAANGLLNLSGRAEAFTAGMPLYGFAEPGTGAEAFIAKNAPSGRSLQIADEAARWHGGRVVPDGAMRIGATQIATPRVTVENNVVVMLPDGTQLHAQIMDVSQQYKFRSSVSGMG